MRKSIALITMLSLILVIGATVTAQAAKQTKNPVLLVHGIASGPNDWKSLPTYLGKEGYDVFVLDFNEWADLDFASKKTKGFEVLAAVIARQTAMIRSVTGAEKINVVAHSIGGLAVRAYIANWGQKIENRARYADDIEKIVYLGTPFFGIEKNGKDVKEMIKASEYGPFMDHNEILNSIRYATPELVEMLDYFEEYGSDLGLQEVTVYADKDHLVKNFSATLDGTRYNPFFVPRPTAAADRENDSMHVTIRGFDHATHANIGNNKKTYMQVRERAHPTFKVVKGFFNGDDSWKNVRQDIKADKDSMVLLRVAKGSGISLSSFTPGQFLLKRVTSSKTKKVRLTWHGKSELFYFTKMNTGMYELSYPPAGENYKLIFDLTIHEGAGQVATFDLTNMPFDVYYDPEPGDMYIAPGDIPSAITDYTSLRRFILAAFPFESRNYRTANAMTTLVDKIKRAIVATYPSIEAGTGDIDKFALSSTTDIDWMSNPKNEGCLANRLSWTEIVKEEPKEDPGEGGGGGNLPKGITIPKSIPKSLNDVNSLRLFALYHFGADLFVQRSDQRPLARKLRDKIVAQYKEYFLPWDDSDRSHFDAFADRYKRITVDFVSGVDAGGQLYYKLGWGIHDDPIWAK